MLTSRSGSQSLLRGGNNLPRKIISYLKSRDDLQLRLEKSDATSLEDMSSLLQLIGTKLAGCFLLTTSSTDRSFAQLSQEEFDQSYASKLGVLHKLSGLVDVDKLDFLMVFSSISALIGNAGQTTYCSYVLNKFSCFHTNIDTGSQCDKRLGWCSITIPKCGMLCLSSHCWNSNVMGLQSQQSQL